MTDDLRPGIQSPSAGKSPVYSRQQYILSVTVGYGIFAAGWIFLTDQLMTTLFDVAAIQWLSTVKGLFFVLVTTLLLFFALRNVPDPSLSRQAMPSLETRFSRSLRNQAWLYGFAVLASIGMLLLRDGIAISFNQRPLLILFMFPIVLSAVVGGLGPGLVATLVSSVCAAYNMPPAGYFIIKEAHDIFQWGFLVANGVLISLLAERLHRSRWQTEVGRQLQAVTLSSIGDAVITTDADGMITFINPEAERLTGWPSREAMGQPLGAVFRIVNEQTRQPVEDPVHKVLSSGEVVGLANHTSLIGRNGRELPVVDSGAPIRLADGSLVGVVLVFRDDTIRRHAELVLQQERSFLKALIRTLPDLVWLKDPKGIYLACNARFESLLGASEEEIVGKSDYDFWDRELADFFRQKDREAMAKGGPSVNEEEVTYADDGHRELLETIKTPMLDSKGGLIGILGIARDITAARQAETALRAQDELLRDMSRVAHIGAWGFDPVTGQGSWTEEVARIHEVETSLAPTVQFGLEFYRPGESREKIEAAVHEAVELGKPYDLELELVTAKGNHKWVRTMGMPVVEDGRVVRVRGALQDITERKTMELALRQSEKTYRSLFENMLNGFAFCQILYEHGRPMDFIYLDVNQAFEDLTGLRDVVGRRVTEVIPGIQEADRELFEIYGRVAMGGTPERFEVFVNTLDMWFAISVYSPKREHFVAVFDVITDRKRGELALRQSEKRFRDIAEVSADWIWEMDSTGHFTYASENVRELLGYSASEILGKTPFDLMPPEEAARISTAFGAIAARHERFRDLENRNLHRDGSQRHVLTSGVPMLDAQGNLLGYRGVDRDVTAARQAELELRDSLAEKDALLREVHHRVKNNLQIVASLLNLQANRTVTPEALAALLDTRNRVHSMALLHETLYRSDSLARISLTIYVDELATQLLRSFGKAIGRVAVERRVSPIRLPLDQAVPCGLIINELVTNALKYGFPNERTGEVVVEIVQEPGWVVLAVSDNGIGLPEGFEPEDSSTLGLQLVTKLAGQLGGRLTWERGEKGGARFSVRFPFPSNVQEGERA